MTRWIYFYLLILTLFYLNNLYSEEYPEQPLQPPHESYYSDLQILHNHEAFPKMDLSSFGGYTQETQGANTNTVGDINSQIESIISLLPESSRTRQGLERYLSIINANSYGDDSSVGLSNEGLSAHGNNLVRENPCFAHLAEAFYTEIHQRDRSFIEQNMGIYRDSLIQGRPSLSQVAGEGDFEELQPGWLQELAMEYANDNPRLALSLVSLCGHDDVLQGELTYNTSVSLNEDSSRQQEILSSLNYYIENLRTQLSAAESMLAESMSSASMTDPSSSDQLGHERWSQRLRSNRQHLEEVLHFQERLENDEISISSYQRQRGVQCPSNISTFYLSQSMGEDADIPLEQKDRVAAIQAPSLGSTVLPSKNYHIMASAYLTCELISEGFPPRLAQQIQTIAGWSYRTIRLSHQINEDLSEYHRYQDEYNRFVANYNRENATERLSPVGMIETVDTPAPSFESWYVDNDVGLQAKTPSSEVAERSMRDADAAFLINQLTIGGGEILGFRVPHTSLRLNLLGDPISHHIEGALSNDSQNTDLDPPIFNRAPEGWSEERYQNALEKAATYLIDWEWTTAQHRAGAEFAANHCEESSPGFELEQQACESFSLRPGRTCDIDYSGRQESQAPINYFDINGFPMDQGQLHNLSKISGEIEAQILDSAITTEDSLQEQVIHGLW